MKPESESESEYYEPEYLVIWEVEVNASCAMDAARKAHRMQRNPESTASLFEVHEAGTSRHWTIDTLLDGLDRDVPTGFDPSPNNAESYDAGLGNSEESVRPRNIDLEYVIEHAKNSEIGSADNALKQYCALTGYDLVFEEIVWAGGINYIIRDKSMPDADPEFDPTAGQVLPAVK